MGVGQVRGGGLAVGGGALVLVFVLVVVAGGEQAGDGCREAGDQAMPAEVGTPAGVRHPRGWCRRPAADGWGVTVSVRIPVDGGGD